MQTTTTRQPRAAVASVVAAVLLAACGGGGDDSGNSSGSGGTVTAPPADQAWLGELPAQATQLAPIEFRRQLDAGELRLVTRHSPAAQRVMRERRLQDDLATLTALPSPGEAVQSLLARAGAQATPYAEPHLRLNVGAGAQTLRLQSLAQELASAADAQRQAADPEALRARYAMQWSLLGEAQRATLTEPVALAGQGVAEVQAALAQLESALAQLPLPDGSALTPQTSAAAVTREQAQVAPVAGTSADTPSCTHRPDGLWSAFYWPLRNFTTEVRDQGRRGSCWAFAAVGALEARERVQTQQSRNLSEQFLVNQVKALWDAEDFEDGYVPERALDSLVSRRQGLPPESFWTYNAAPGRELSGEGSDGEDSYNGSCSGYNGSCSATAHQSPPRCSTFDGSMFCGYSSITFGDAGTPASPAVQVWNGSGALPLNGLRALLSNGVPVLASFGVRIGFEAPQNGFVTDFRDVHSAGSGTESGSKGGHAVLFTGFIDSASVQAAIDAGRINLPGGVATGAQGYFIVKNSWGCHGDAGYTYIPDTYVARFFTRLSALNFSAARSTAWQEQNYLRPLSGLARVDLRVLTALFSAAPPPGGSIAQLQVQASSSHPADRFDIDTTFGVHTYRATFQSPGPRTIDVRASYPGVAAVQTLRMNVDVVNTPPRVQPVGLPNGTLQVAETYALSVNLTDPNEANPSARCATALWQVSGADLTLDPSGSCSQRVRFAQEGTRSVRVSVTDSDGATTTTELLFVVGPAPANPFPRITGAGVGNASVQRGLNCLIGTAVAQGATLDLTRPVTSTSCSGTPNTANYHAGAAVENPSGEPLTTAWQLWVDEPGRTLQASSEPAFAVTGAPFGTGGTRACGIVVTIGPQDVSRIKRQPVWQGSCTVPAVVPH